jgi:hypothetical protein
MLLKCDGAEHFTFQFLLLQFLVHYHLIHGSPSKIASVGSSTEINLLLVICNVTTVTTLVRSQFHLIV